MKLYYYRGRTPNFGDELNAWLWPRLLPDFFDDDDSSIFLGIGSTLYDFLPRDSRKIVFGAGYGGYTPVPAIDDRWTFYFVRGRMTAEKLRLDPSMAIGDAAILVRSCAVPKPAKTHAVSFMPHWESARDGDWTDTVREAGLHYIDPSGSVERVLADILASELVVTEAMHGAIVADALRVPWVPVRPLQPRHRMKWLDWASALDLDLEFGTLSASNAFESALSLTRGRRRYERWVRSREHGLRRVAGGAFRARAVRSLVTLSRGGVHLSRDTAIELAHSRMLEQLQRLRRDFA
jgi:exopolysaccharide glucosyl ketal-pyruvate-transferase